MTRRRTLAASTPAPTTPLIRWIDTRRQLGLCGGPLFCTLEKQCPCRRGQPRRLVPALAAAPRMAAVLEVGGRAAGLDWMSRGSCRREDPDLFFPAGLTGPAPLDRISVAQPGPHRPIPRGQPAPTTVPSEIEGLASSRARSYGGQPSSHPATRLRETQGTSASGNAGAVHTGRAVGLRRPCEWPSQIANGPGLALSGVRGRARRDLRPGRRHAPVER